MSRRRSRSSIFSSRRRSSRLRRSKAVSRLSRRGRIPLALDEGVPQEQLAGERPVESGELGATPRDDLDAEQRHLLVDGCRAGRLRPVRLAQLALGEVAGERLSPGRVDRGDGAREQPRGLDELGRHDRRGGLLAQSGAGEDREPRCRARRCTRPRRWRLGPRAAVGLGGGRPRRGALVQDADVGQQPRQDRLVQVVRVGPSLSKARRWRAPASRCAARRRACAAGGARRPIPARGRS